jgi:hypothetical protein
MTSLHTNTQLRLSSNKGMKFGHKTKMALILLENIKLLLNFSNIHDY